MDTLWPSDKDILPYKKPTTAAQIERLFYHVGLSVSGLYVLLHLVVSRVIYQAYQQRLELNHEALMRLRRLVNKLRSKVKTTSITSLGENRRLTKDSKVYIDRCQQTSEGIKTPGDDYGWAHLNRKLDSLTKSLEEYNKIIGETSYLESLTFESKLFTDQCKGVGLRLRSQEKGTKLINSVREMKGWFIHGRIPRD
ncbi:peroxisomal membrane protein PEX17 [Kluyveromyces marxianus]|uniref:Peroxisomal membrane protein PEX17 n=2 Tax=Kluyveromyces marxianus TaxID=4911 RepID=W0TCV4_KLUMD|nr:peroxisomal membrane protein PEX17 [Kluyveromyces marxianus DMKU3-1042]QGN16960.1 peroxisomal membrane protein PEX17 [Kluyveromyces marxianus]BAO41255.1 peroxisomal membrane protein PEX17 [Kluyveromyces marxianus DMKU3-1042]